MTVKTPTPAAALYPIERTRSVVWRLICILGPVTSTTPVTSPSGPVSKMPLFFSPDSSVVTGQAGFAEQFQGFQELARSAEAGPVTSTTADTSPSVPVSKEPLVNSPDSSVVTGQAGFTEQFHDLQKLARSADPGPVTFTTPAPNPSVPVSIVPLVSSLDSPVVTGQAEVAEPFQDLQKLARSAKSAPVTSTTPATSPSVPVSTVPLVPSPDSSVVTGQAGFAERFHGLQELARATENAGKSSGGSDSGSASSPRARIVAGTSGRSARPAASTTAAAATPEGATATAGAAAPASVPPRSGKIGPSANPGRIRASGATQADRLAGSVESGVEQNPSPAPDLTDPNASNAPISNVPLFAWFEQAASPNQVQNLHESAAPAESGAKSSDGGAPASDGLQLPAGKEEAGHSDAAAPAAITHQTRLPQPPPVSSKLSLVVKDGVESPASGTSNSAAAAPHLAPSQAGAQAAAAIAHPPFVQAAPPDTGITPPGVPSPAPEKPAQPVSDPNPRAAAAESGTPGKAEPVPADLAVAVRVKAQTSPAASGQSAPAKELRRVDVTDAPPAASLRTETARAGAWVFNEGPARTGSQPAAETASRLPERLEAAPIRAEAGAPKTAAPLKDLSVQVGQSSQESVELRVVEREGELHVAVRTGDADLAHGLRQGLLELVDHLDQSGFRSEAWRPSGVVSAPEPSSQAPSRSSESRNADSQSQPGWSQQERGQRDHNQSHRPKWVEELEGNLAGGGESSTGGSHGFSH